MKNCISISPYGCVGFGTTNEEAKYDAYVNDCRQDLTRDVDGVFKEKRERLSPWLPTNNICHITGVGALYASKGFIMETSTGNKVDIFACQYSIYFYIATLFGDKLTYEEITVVLRPELDKFFTSVIPGTVPIKDWPYIKLENTDNGFNPSVIYNMAGGIIVGIAPNSVGIKRVGDDLYHTVDIPDSVEHIYLLSYIAYKMGIILGQKELLVKE